MSTYDDIRRSSGKKQPPLWPVLLLALLLIGGGAGVFFYPTVANYLAERNAATVIEDYEQGLQKTDTSVLQAEWERAREYNANLAGTDISMMPFQTDGGHMMSQDYLDVLNMNGDGVMGYISIPKIRVKLPIFHGCGEDSLQRGSGHLEQIHLPIGGAGIHAVLSGHRGLPHAEMFTRLDELENGDIFLLHVLNSILAYEMDQITVVEPEKVDSLGPAAGEDLVTLITCHPLGDNYQRYIVFCERAEE